MSEAALAARRDLGPEYDESIAAGLAERMARERDIGALLEHPAIARLYDAGVDERGRPYLALEFIDGQPIHAWCEAFHCRISPS